MHDQPTFEPELSPAELDARNQNDLLRHLLEEYPAPFTHDELVSELTAPGEEGRSERDDFLRAIRDLTCCGLLHQHGPFVWPSRAAKSAWVLREG